MTVGIDTSIDLTGEDSYLSALKNIRSETSLLNAELKANTAQYDGNANSAAALESKINILSKQYDLQKTKLEQSNAILAAAKQRQVEYGSTVEALRQKLSGAQAALTRMKDAEGDNTVAQQKITAEIEKHRKALAEAEKAYDSTCSKIDKYEKNAKTAQTALYKLDSELTNNRKYLAEAQVSADGCATSIDAFGKKVRVAAKETDAASESLDTAADKMDNTSKVADGAAKVLGVAAAAMAAAAVDTAKKAIEAQANYQQLAGGVETLFKDSADTVKAYADDAFKTAGLSANDYLHTITSFSASLLASLGGDTAAAADAANSAIIDMADNANKMGTDIASIQNAYQGFAKQQYTLLDNLKLGYGGTKTEMERLLADAEKLSGMDYDISSLSDVYDAIHVVQTALDITGTTAAEAEETISGSLAAMGAAWTNVLTGLAGDTQDMGALMADFADAAATAAGNVGDAIGNIASNLLGIDSVDDITNKMDDLTASLGENSRIEGLFAKYHELQDAMQDTALTTDALASKQLELTDIKKQLIAASNGLIDSTTAEGAELDRYLGLLEGYIRWKGEDEKREYLDGLADSAEKYANAVATVAANEALAADAEKRYTEEFAKQSEGLTYRIRIARDDLMSSIDDGLLNQADGYNQMQIALSDIADMIEELSGQEFDFGNITDLDSVMDTLGIDVGTVTDAISNAKDTWGDYAQAAQTAADRQADAMDEFVYAVKRGWMTADEVAKQLGVDLDVVEKALNGDTEATKDLSDATERTERRVSSARDTGAAYAKAVDNATDVMTKAASTTRDLAGANDQLKMALDEQTNSGTLSADTINDLIDRGYGLALQINEETGAVTVNEEAYLSLAAAKIDEQIASVEAQIAARQAADAMMDEALQTASAATASNSYCQALIDQAIAERAAKAAKDDTMAALNAEKAALEGVRAGLGKYTVAATTASGSGAKAATKAKTDAEVALEEYKKLVKELDHQMAMDEIAEADYWAQMAQYREQYLTGEGNLDEYRKNLESLHRWQEQAVEQSAKVMSTNFDAEKSNLANQYKDGKISAKDYCDALTRITKAYTDDYAANFANAQDVIAAAQADTLAEIETITQDYLDASLADFGNTIDTLSDNAATALQDIKDDIDDVMARQADMASALADTELIVTGTDDNGKTTAEWNDKGISGVNADLDTMLGLLTELEGKDGVTDNIMSGLYTGLQSGDLAEAIASAELILASSDAKLSEMSALADKEAALAIKIAENCYSDKLTALQTTYDETYGKWMEELESTSKTYGEGIVDGLTAGVDEQKSAFITALENLAADAKKALSGMALGVSVTATTEQSTINGSHAAGLDYVPFDGYTAQLHQGERILTSAESRALDNAFAYPTQVNNPGVNANSQQLSQILAAIAAVAEQTANPTPVTVDITNEIDGAVLGHKVFPHLQAESRRRGSCLTKT